MLTFPRPLVSSPRPYSTLPWPRCVWLRPTHLSSVPCIHRRFPGSLRRGRSRQRQSLLSLLTVVVFPLWCCGHRSELQWPPPLPQPSRVRSGGGSRVRHPFRLPLGAPPAPVASEVVLGRSPPDRVSPPCWVGGCLSAHWRHWQAIGAESWVLSVLQDGYRIPFRDSPPPLQGLPSSPSGTLPLLWLAPRYHFRPVGQDLLGHWLYARRSRRCCPRTPWKSSLIRVPASAVIFSFWKR